MNRVRGRAGRLGGAATSLLLAAVLAGGCAPGTPDDDSWRIDAQRAVSNAASAVLTAELALRQSERGRGFDRYLQTVLFNASLQPVLVNAEKGVGTAGDAIGSRQPPRAERDRYDTVTGQIDEAAS